MIGKKILIGALAAVSQASGTGGDSELIHKSAATTGTGTMDRVKSVLSAAFGGTSPEDKIKGFLGIPDVTFGPGTMFTLDKVEAKIEDPSAFGKCDFTRGIGVPMPASVDMSRLLGVSRGKTGAPGNALDSWLAHWGYSSVTNAKTGEIIVLSTGGAEIILREARASFVQLLRACEAGLLDKFADDIGRPCFSGNSAEDDHALYPDLELGPLLNCLLARGVWLGKEDRKITEDLIQIEKDMIRTDIKDLDQAIPNRCQTISLTFTTKVAPWYNFAQAGTEACFYVLYHKGGDEAQALKAIIVMRDKITRMSRYSAREITYYPKWLALYWSHALMFHFPLTFESNFFDRNRFYGGIDAYLSRPSSNVAVLDFIFTNGRPGLWAYYVAGLKTCWNAYKTYEVEKSRGGPLWEDKRRLMQVPADYTAEVPPYKYDGLDEVNLKNVLLANPPIVCFGPWMEPMILREAREILRAKFSYATHQEVRQDTVGGFMTRIGKGIKGRATGIEVDEDEIEEVMTEEGVPDKISFAQLVELIDAVVDVKMKDAMTAIDQLDSDVAPKELKAEFLRSTGLDLDKVHANVLLEAYHVDPKKCEGADHYYRIADKIRSTASAIHSAQTLFDTPVITRTTLDLERGDAESVAYLQALIAAHEPLKITVDGVSRQLPAVSYNDLLAEMKRELDQVCGDGRFLNPEVKDTFHQCVREMPDLPEEMRELKYDGERPWFLNAYLWCMYIPEKTAHSALLRNHAWALARIRQETVRLSSSSFYRFYQELKDIQLDRIIADKVIASDCEEILAVYALKFTNSPDAIMDGEPVGWCYSLRKMGLPKQDTMYAISVLSNKIVGSSRYGPRQAVQYIHTLASFLLSALRTYTRGFEYSGPDRFDRGHQAIVKKLQDLAVESYYMLTLEFWIYIFKNGRHGFLCFLVSASLLSQGEPGTGKSSQDRVLEGIEQADRWCDSDVLVPGDVTDDFGLPLSRKLTTIFDIVDTLVDGSMMTNRQ
jgi:hypothetical protein